MLHISLLLALAAFIGYLVIALALPLEDGVNNAFIRGMYTAEVYVRPQLTHWDWQLLIPLTLMESLLCRILSSKVRSQ